MAVVGALTLRRIGIRVLAGGLTIGMLSMLLLVGTPMVHADGSYTGYWGFLFLPVVVAWAPLGWRLPAALFRAAPRI